ncbi:MAG TPA: peptide deformylase [Flavobacterium sp.]|nr:peptide deformylase [Flavobacterium sp.]
MAFAQHFDKSEKKRILSGSPKEKMRVIQSDVEDELITLTSVSKDISHKAKELELLIDRMYLTVTDLTDGGVGIAAPQVGINRNIIWVQRFDKKDEPFEVYLNPKIVWRSKLIRKGMEGCLSIPEIREDVYRNYVIEIEYLTRRGEKRSEKVEGFTAVIFQHEVDHLNGILFTDRLLAQEKQKFLLINPEVELYLEKRLLRQ